MGFFRQTSRTLWYVNIMDKMAQKGEDHLAWLDQQMAKRKGDDTFKKNILFDYARRLENRAKKAQAMKTHAHCQICERSIQANTGVIAHHGYTRPGHGWQTASCYGARHQPVEVACDAMQPYIDMVTQFKSNREAGLKGLLEEPPETMTITVQVKPYKAVTVERPKNFNPVNASQPGYYPPHRSYESEWKARVSQAVSEIKNAEAEIERMTKRLAEWKPKINQKGDPK